MMASEYPDPPQGPPHSRDNVQIFDHGLDNASNAGDLQQLRGDPPTSADLSADVTVPSGFPAAAFDTADMTTPERMAQGVLDVGGQSSDGAAGAEWKKRSKVTRACDGCRRKKSRCDGTPGQDGPCTNCQKAGVACQFSREPMKRGPSKGWVHPSHRLVHMANVYAATSRFSPIGSTRSRVR